MKMVTSAQFMHLRSNTIKLSTFKMVTQCKILNLPLKKYMNCGGLN